VAGAVSRSSAHADARRLGVTGDRASLSSANGSRADIDHCAGTAGAYRWISSRVRSALRKKPTVFEPILLGRLPCKRRKVGFQAPALAISPAPSHTNEVEFHVDRDHLKFSIIMRLPVELISRPYKMVPPSGETVKVDGKSY
jgi:hypothetical protein